MIIVGYNPRALPNRFTEKRTASSIFKPEMLDALYRVASYHRDEWSPSVSIMLVGQTAADFAEAHW